MGKKIQKLVALLLVTVLALSGCSKNTTPDSGKSNSDAGEKTEQGKEQGKNDEKPVEITVMAWDRGDNAPGTTPEDNTLTKWIQEQMLAEHNIKVKFMTVPRSGSDDKLNVMMAGGTAPDIVFTFNRSLFLDYASKGGLTDLSESIEKYGSNLKEYVGEDVLDLCNIDGKQYGVSATQEALKRNQHTVYMRKDWLDALGREVPTTKAEFIETLYEFKEKDPGKVGDKLVPWAVSGKADTDRHFTNFVFSYADPDQWDEKSMYIYEGYIKGIKPGTKEGFRILNQLYNDGIISQDFAIDTSEDKYKQDLTSGYAGVIVETGDTPINEAWYDTLKSNVPEAEWVVINCFENYEGKYTRPGTPLLQKMILVPKTSEEKADAIVKYLDWIVQPEVASTIVYGPDAKKDENGKYVPMGRDEKAEKGYPNTTGDYNLLNRNYDGLETKEEIVKFRLAKMPYLTEEYLSYNYDVVTKDIYFEPVFKKPMENTVKYGANLDKLVVELGYKVVSTSVDKFDQVYEEEYQKMVEAGLEKVLVEREEYYNQNVAK